MKRSTISNMKIGPYKYEVHYIDDLKDPDNNNRLHGMHSHSKLEIMCEGMDHPQVQIATIWHEAMHAAFDLSGVNIGDQAEETVCTALSPIIIQMIRDNPKLVKATLG